MRSQPGDLCLTFSGTLAVTVSWFVPLPDLPSRFNAKRRGASLVAYSEAVTMTSAIYDPIEVTR